MRTLNSLFVLAVAACCLLTGHAVPSNAVPNSTTAAGKIGLLAPAVTPVVLKGRRIKLPQPCSGSWCDDGHVTLGEGEKYEIPALGFHCRIEQGEFISLGRVNVDWAGNRISDYSPLGFEGPKYSDKLAKTEMLYAPLFTERGIWIEVADKERQSTAVFYVKARGNGVLVGVVSGWEFELESEKLYVIDANADGLMSKDDRMVYEFRSVWMPWHSVTISGATVYTDLTPESAGVLKAKTFKVPVPPRSETAWTFFQELRKDQGLPPGVFSSVVQRSLSLHAAYCRSNAYQGYQQVDGKPGFSKEGQAIAKSAAMSFEQNQGPLGRLDGMFRSYYQRHKLLDPTSVAWAYAANDSSIMWAGGSDPDIPPDARVPGLMQISPAPGTVLPWGGIGEDFTALPTADKLKSPGYPISVRFFGEPPKTAPTVFTLSLVEQKKSKNSEGKEVLTDHFTAVTCTLVTPEMDKQLDAMGLKKNVFTLVPHSQLTKGEYEVALAFEQVKARKWRFKVQS